MFVVIGIIIGLSAKSWAWFWFFMFLQASVDFLQASVDKD
jgi:hypothetical protein